MKKILVFSDLHYPSMLRDFPEEIIAPYLKQTDLVFGLGDYVTRAGLDLLYGLGKEVYAVSGNTDEHLLKIQLPPIMTLEIEGIKIGLAHGWGSKHNLRHKIFKEINGVDLICYGHTHQPFFNKEFGIWFFNPGSLGGYKQSFGFLTIDDKKIDGKIINIK